MPARRFFAVGLWLAVTASATAIVWAGTSTVAADLTDRPAPVVDHNEVVMALQSGSLEDKTAPGITTPEANSSASTDRPGSAGAAPNAPPGAGPQTAQPGGGAPSPRATPPTSQPTSPPPTQPPSPPTTRPPSRPTATYSTAGGAVTVACNGSVLIELVSATPNHGYAVNVANAGPSHVEVHFVRGRKDTPVWAYCLGQPVRAYGGPPGQGQTGPS